MLTSTAPVLALSDKQKKVFNKGIYYYNVESCQIAVEREESSEASPDGDLASLAAQMLENSNITYWTNNGVNTRDVVEALKEGRKAYTTAPDGQPEEADLNPNILKFILEASKKGKVMVNALTDKDHSTNSNHYKGLAVDLDSGAGNTTVPVSTLITIARKYGGVKNNESHHHFDFLQRPSASDPQDAPQPAESSSSGDEGEEETRINPNDITFPDLPEEGMASAIEKFIKKTKPNSKLKGAGQKLVASAKNSNINPFLVIALAKKESQLADPSDYNVRNGNNAFGRTATASQPNFQGARLWYKWSSVPASVDHTARENNRDSGDHPAYLRSVYNSELDSNDLTALMNKYAPPHENDTALYIREIKADMTEMTKLTGSHTGGSNDSTGSCKCGVGGSGADGALSGSENAEKAFNFFVSKGFSPEQAAGIVGNLAQESSAGLNPKLVEQGPYSGGVRESETVPGPIGPQGQPGYGIAQWTTPSRKEHLKRFADEQNKPVSSLELQLSFIIEEMGSLNAEIKAMNSGDIVREAALRFHSGYERSADTAAMLEERVSSGKEILTKYGSGATSTSSGESTSCVTNEEGAGEVTGEYGFPLPKKFYNQDKAAFNKPHHGTNPAIDIPVPVGTPVYSITAGTVVLAPVGGDCGTGVLINTDAGIEYVYCHGTDGGSVNGAKQGDKVKPGQLIMHSGNTGRSSGPHLHIQIRVNGSLSCPQKLLIGIAENNPVKEESLPKSGCNSGSNPNV